MLGGIAELYTVWETVSRIGTGLNCTLARRDCCGPIAGAARACRVYGMAHHPHQRESHRKRHAPFRPS